MYQKVLCLPNRQIPSLYFEAQNNNDARTIKWIEMSDYQIKVAAHFNNLIKYYNQLNVQLAHPPDSHQTAFATK